MSLKCVLLCVGGSIYGDCVLANLANVPRKCFSPCWTDLPRATLRRFYRAFRLKCGTRRLHARLSSRTNGSSKPRSGLVLITSSHAPGPFRIPGQTENVVAALAFEHVLATSSCSYAVTSLIEDAVKTVAILCRYECRRSMPVAWKPTNGCSVRQRGL